MLPKLEAARQQKQIGKALDAWLTIKTNLPGDAIQLEIVRKPDLFQEILGVSKLELSAPPALEGNIADVVTVGRASDNGCTKCERCWHWETEVGANAEHPTLCARCVEAVRQCDCSCS